MKLALKTKAQPAECCAMCRYYQGYEDIEEEEEDEPEAVTGICRRYPPVMVPGIPATSVYPDVARSGWCGEFIPRQ